MLFANTLGDAQKVMKTFQYFCLHTKLSVNKSRGKIMFVKSKTKKPCIMYGNELGKLRISWP